MVERVIVGPWKTNCYIYSSSKKECIIIDPGGDEVEIASRVDVLNMVPVGIALTHGHVDHLAALGKLQASYASRGYTLPIAISTADRRFLGSGALEAHKESLKVHAMDEMAFFGGDPLELPKADVRLKEGDRVFDMDLVVLETPGHTPGSLCFYSEKEGVLFSGDTIFFDGVGRTDLPGGSERKLRESIEKKIAVLPPETRVFPGHGPFTTVERERRGNPFLRQQPPEPKHPEPRKPARPSPRSPAKVLKTRAAGRAKVARRPKPRLAGARPRAKVKTKLMKVRPRPAKPARGTASHKKAGGRMARARSAVKSVVARKPAKKKGR
ncbi:MAG: MBL fold metallo-hydrolase [Spirochaetia bacterium]